MAKAGEWRTLQPALSERVLRVLEEELKFSAMTPVQAATLPHFLKNADVAVEVYNILIHRFLSWFSV